MSPHALTPEALLENQGWLLNVVRHLVKDEFDAEDIVQETILEAIHSPNARPDHKGWLAAVARNKALEWLRKSRRRYSREQKASRDATAQRILDSPMEIAELSSLVMSSIEDLPEDQQRALLLKCVLEYKPAEISEQMEISVQEVYRLTERGRTSIQKRLEARHGRDWREHCSALVGIKLIQSTSSLAVPLLAAAVTLVVAVGAWFGLDRFMADDSAPPVAMESAEIVEASLDQPAAASDVSPTDLDASLALLREDQPSPAASFYGVLAKPVLPNQDTLPFTEVIANWEPSFYQFKSFWTDENGIAKVILPQGVRGFSLHTKVPGYLNPFVSSTSFQSGELFQIPLIQGAVGQTLRAVDYQGQGLEGTLIRTYILDGPPGYFVSGPDGYVDALLERPGHYTIHMDDNFAFDWQHFEVSNQSTAEAFTIPCVKPPTDVRLRAVDADTGSTLISASFWGEYNLLDEYNLAVQSNLQIQMASINGALEYPGNLFEPKIHAVIIRAPGYEPVKVTVFQDPEIELVVELDKSGSHPARFELPNPDRQIVNATVSKSVKRVSYPVWNGFTSSSTPGTTTTIPLVVDAQGGFQLPYDETDTGHLVLNVTDDQGTIFSSLTFPQDLIANETGEFVFPFLPPAAQDLSLKIVDDQGHPQADVSLIIRAPDREPPFVSRPTTDADGMVKLKVAHGESISISFEIGQTHIEGDFQAPTGTQELDLVLKLPPLTHSLIGDVLLADGQAAQATASSRWLDTFDFHLPGNVVAPMGITVSSSQFTGQMLVQGVPAGDYETTVRKTMRNNGLMVTKQHSANQATVFQLPLAREYKYRVFDGQGRLLSDVGFRTCTDTTPGFELGRCGRSQIGGLAHFEVEQTPIVQAILLVAPGFAPVYAPPYVSNELIDIRMEALGRELIIVDTAAKGVLLETDKFWIIDAWGNASDPRQGLVSEYYDGNDLRVTGAPLGEFNFVEIDSTGRLTGRVINVPAL